MPFDSLNRYFKDDLDFTAWLGEVVDVADPLKVGRVRIKVYGKFDLIPTEDIPWAYPANNFTGGSPSGGGMFSVPKLGSIVSVRFDAGNIYHPEYYFNQKLSDDAKAEIENSYENAHIIVYDTVTAGSLKIFFTEEKGLMLDYQQTQINIKNDKSILIQTASGNSKAEILDDGKLKITQASDIEVTTDTDVKIKAVNVIIDHSTSIELGKGASEKVILGNSFLKLFNQHTHVGNLGAPTSPPMQPMLEPTHLSGKGGNPKTTVK
jgi:hypothetical protein